MTVTGTGHGPEVAEAMGEGAARLRTEALISGADVFRRSPSRFGPRLAYKEWQHFLVHVPPSSDGPGLELIVNFNLLDDVHSPVGEVEVARVIVLARSDGWTGITLPIPSEEVRVTAGSLDARFGDHSMRWDGTGYEVTVDAPERELLVRLRFEPQTVPGLAVNQPLAPGVRLSWLFVPRLTASGVVRLGDRIVEVEGALAYHDHNWSVFSWGDDFTWEWASVLPESPECPWSLVLMRLMDRRRTRVRSQAIFLWRGAERVRTFRDHRLEVDSDGRWRDDGAAPFRIPPVMRMLTSGRAPDVPARWRARAVDGADRLELDFSPAHVSQVVMPGERGLETVAVLNEATGSVRVRGVVGGEPLDFRARGVFEFLRCDGRDDPAQVASSTSAASRLQPPAEAIPFRVSEFVEASFRLLSRELPQGWARLLESLDGMRVALVVDQESFHVAFEAATGSATVDLDPSAESGAVVRTTGRSILRVIDGEIDLHDAVLSGEVDARGSLDALERLLDGLVLYVHVAVRCPSAPRLLESFRSFHRYRSRRRNAPTGEGAAR